MKTLLLLSLLTFAQSVRAESLPYPVVIAPRPALPALPSTTVQAPTLTTTLQVYSSPVPVQADRPAVAVAVPVRR
jgi:hypothetical protein